MTFRWLRLIRWVMVSVCGLLVLSACADEAPAAPSPSVSATASETPTPQPTDEPEPVATDRAGEPLVAPERPAAMDNDDVAGAQAAAEYFIELYGYATRSQDLREFTDLCDPESKFCMAVIDEVSADVAAGTVTVGGSTRFTTTAVDPPGEDPYYVVWGAQSRTPFIAYAADGSMIYNSTGDEGLDVAILIERQADGDWVVREGVAGVVPEP